MVNFTGTGVGVKVGVSEGLAVGEGDMVAVGVVVAVAGGAVGVGTGVGVARSHPNMPSAVSIVPSKRNMFLYISLLELTAENAEDAEKRKDIFFRTHIHS